MEDLKPGDYLYQASDELFLVCIENRENEIEFAVHGWRTIDKDRLDHYIEPEEDFWGDFDDELHTEEQVQEIINESDDPEASEKLTWLTQIFDKYAEASVSEDSEHGAFAMDDT